MLATHDADCRHDHDDGDELQEHAQAHEFLRAVGRAAAHHIDQAEQQDNRNGDDGSRHEIK